MLYYDTVIVGGGAGGLELAAKLGRYHGRKTGAEKVLLIDRSIVHIWKPTLHEVAVGTLNPQQEGLLYSMLARLNHFSFMLGQMEALNAEQKFLTVGELKDDDGSVLMPEQKIHFKNCILALGCGSNSFNTKGFERAFVLEKTEDAQKFHKHLFARFLQTSYSETSRQLSVAIVGAGATGVELSAEMIESYHEALQVMGKNRQFGIDIHLIEAGKRILLAMPENLAEQAQSILLNKNIKVHTETQVQEITENEILTNKGNIRADMVIWAAGIKASERNKNFGLNTNPINQFIVNEQLETSAPNVYALGDCSSLVLADGSKIPATAQAAHQQAKYLTKKLIAQFKEKPFVEKFQYQDGGALVSLGFDKGVGGVNVPVVSKQKGSIFIKGLLAKWAHMSLHLMHHFTVLGFWRTVLLAWARLVTKRVSGRLKLH